MAWTQTDLNNIKAAIASGELEVVLEGRRALYRSIDELEKAKALIEAELAAIATPRTRASYAYTFTTLRGF